MNDSDPRSPTPFVPRQAMVNADVLDRESKELKRPARARAAHPLRARSAAALARLPGARVGHPGARRSGSSNVEGKSLGESSSTQNWHTEWWRRRVLAVARPLLRDELHR